MTQRSLWYRVHTSRAWRLPATAFGFGVFGAGSLLLSFTIFPLLLVAPLAAEHRYDLSRRVISRVFRGYVILLRTLRLLSYEFHGEPALRQPNQLIIANHPSLLDVVFIIGFAGNASCVVKGSLWRNPFTAFAVRAANYIRNDRLDLYDACLQTLKRGESLIIFPEGTRSRPGEPLSFHRGCANIALSAGMDFTPVVVQCRPAALLKHQKWYRIAAEPSHFVFRVMPRIPVAHYMAGGQMQSAASRQLNRDLMAFYEREVAR